MVLRNELTGGEVVGNVEMLPLGSVKPNAWNPNQMTLETYEALKYGLRNDGWLASQALLVWATDESGVRKDTIIDGEHRFRVARDLGFERGPMVLLHGLAEAKAKALTIAMNQKRGQFDPGDLAALLQSIQYDVPDLSENLGIPHDELMALLETAATPLDLLEEPADATSASGGDGKTLGEGERSAPAADVRMVQLFLTSTLHGELTALVVDLRKAYDTKTVTDTIVEAVRRAHAQLAAERAA